MRNKVQIALLLAAVLMAVVFLGYGCAITPESYVLAKVNGQPITLKDVIEHPAFKRIIDQIAQRSIIRQKAAEEGITVDEEKVKEKLDNMIAEIGPGPSWERWKQMQGLTEEDLLEEFRIRYLYEEMLKRRVNVTDEEVKARFDNNPLFYKRAYARENNLTEDEADKLTFEDIKGWLKDYVITTEAYAMGQKVLDELMASADIDYLFLPPEERQRLKQEQLEKRKALEAEKQEKEGVQVEEEKEPEVSENKVEEKGQETVSKQGGDNEKPNGSSDEEKTGDETSSAGQETKKNESPPSNTAGVGVGSIRGG